MTRVSSGKVLLEGRGGGGGGKGKGGRLTSTEDNCNAHAHFWVGEKLASLREEPGKLPPPPSLPLDETLTTIILTTDSPRL